MDSKNKNSNEINVCFSGALCYKKGIDILKSLTEYLENHDLPRKIKFNIATFGDTNNVGTGFILVDSLNTGSDSTKNYVRFVRPTTFAGAATNSADSIAIMQADWHLDSGSACIDAGYGALPIHCRVLRRD